MSITGSCLCGAVRFQFEQAVGPFEICHCTRCRKLTGAQGMPAILVKADGFSVTQGRDCIATYNAPILYRPPAYVSVFCKHCGSPLPEPEPAGDHVEIPAGLLDDDPGLKPDKHIFTEFLPPWDTIAGDLPQYDMAMLTRARHNRELPEDFELKSHDTGRIGTSDEE